MMANPEHSKKSREKLGPGRLVLVVGPSGAGKDTLMNALRQRLAGDGKVLFAKRRITRPADGATETHEPITEKDYDSALASGAYALAWRAHGLGYVLPPDVDDFIRAGGTVVANGSRQALPNAFEKYADPLVLLITAPKAVLAERLAARGRETRASIEKRLERANIDMPGVPHLVRIENTGTIDAGVDKMVAAISATNSDS
jgi:ribose 1,5-bisphosphokinase